VCGTIACVMEPIHDTRETWDRLVLLLIAQPRERWESEFEEIIRREIERPSRPVKVSGMSDAPHIIFRPLPDISPEQVRDASARAWAYALSCYLAKQNVTRRPCGEDGERFTRKGGSPVCRGRDE